MHRAELTVQFTQINSQWHVLTLHLQYLGQYLTIPVINCTPSVLYILLSKSKAANPIMKLLASCAQVIHW
jgi:hypothetical protein